MVLLHTGDIMIMRGKTVWKFNHLTKEYNRMENMPYYMVNSGCSLFHSPTHGNRPVVFIGGGSKGWKAIVLDYTRSTTWEERELCYQMLIVLKLKECMFDIVSASNFPNFEFPAQNLCLAICCLFF